MNKKDLFYVRGNLVSLRLVLGLMDSAESSHDAYQWATSGLIHACRTQDTELCQYIERSLSSQGWSPYMSQEEYDAQQDDEDVDEEYAAPSTTHQISVSRLHTLQSPIRMENEKVVLMKLKMVLEELFDMKDAKGNALFVQKNHWWAVYRIFVDRGILNIQENKYQRFTDLIDRLGVANMTVPLDMTTLSNISQEEVFRLPFKRWSKATIESKRKKTAFDRLYDIADRLNRLLTENL